MKYTKLNLCIVKKKESLSKTKMAREKRYNIVWTEEKKEKALAIITEYLEKYGPGECIAQGDNAIIEAPEVMCEIADSVLIDGEGIIYPKD